MNDFMYEPRCPKCKDLGWIVVNDREYPCECQSNESTHEVVRDSDEDDYDY